MSAVPEDPIGEHPIRDRSAGDRSAAAVASGGPVGTTDILKAVGLALVLVDHVGLFFLTEDGWWRVFGRLAAPIFFFLIGYARSHEVPWTWFVLGLTLTALDFLTTSASTDVQLNLLLSFALIRAASPVLHAEVARTPLRMTLAIGVGVALIPVLAPLLEYGAGGWLWALFGVVQRRASEEPASALDGPVRLFAGAAAGAAYWAAERLDFGFDGVQSAVFAGLVAALTLALFRFRRRVLAVHLPAAVATALRVCGRRSLELYGASLVVMQLAGYALQGPPGGEPDDDDGT